MDYALSIMNKTTKMTKYIHSSDVVSSYSRTVEGDEEAGIKTSTRKFGTAILVDTYYYYLPHL